MGTLKNWLAQIASFLGVCWSIISAFFKPLSGLSQFLGNVHYTASVCLQAIPSWLLGLASLSLVLGVLMLILGRK